MKKTELALGTFLGYTAASLLAAGTAAAVGKISGSVYAGEAAVFAGVTYFGLSCADYLSKQAKKKLTKIK